MESSIYIVLVFVIFIARSHAARVDLDPFLDWQTAITSLSPGDSVFFAAGIYNFSAEKQLTLYGTSSNRISISISGKAVFYPVSASTQPVFNVIGTYFDISGIEIAGGNAGIVISDSDSAVISGVTISGTAVEGVRINNSTNVILQQSEVFQTGAECVKVSGLSPSTGITISNNYVHDCGLSAIYNAAGGNKNIIIRDNVVTGGASGTVCIRVHDDLDSTSTTRGLRVERNFVVATNATAEGIMVVANTIVANNIVYMENPAKDGIQIDVATSSPNGPRNLLVVHNTVSGACSLSASMRAEPNGYPLSNTTIANNVFLCNSSQASIQMYLPNGTYPAGLRWESNTYAVGPLPSDASFPGSSALLVNAANELPYVSLFNFYPGANSAAVDSISFPRNGSWIGDDFLGSVRSASLPTLGAYEYTGSVLPPSLSIGFKVFPNATTLTPVATTLSPSPSTTTPLGSLNTSSASCPQPALPLPFVCIGGRWISNESVTIGSDPLTISGQVDIIGNLTLRNGSRTIVDIVTGRTTPVIHVNGSVQIDGGVLEIRVIGGASPPLNTSIVLFTSTENISSNFTAVIVSSDRDKKNCLAYSAQPSSSRSSFAVILTPSFKQCSSSSSIPIGVVIGAVIAGIVIVVLIIVVLVVLAKKGKMKCLWRERAKERNGRKLSGVYSKRRSEAAMN